MFDLNACSEVVISNVKLEGDVLGKNIKLNNMRKSDVKLDKNSSLVIE